MDPTHQSRSSFAAHLGRKAQVFSRKPQYEQGKGKVQLNAAVTAGSNPLRLAEERNATDGRPCNSMVAIGRGEAEASLTPDSRCLFILYIRHITRYQRRESSIKTGDSVLHY